MISLVRVCPGRLGGVAELSQHQADGSETQEGKRLAVEIFPILGQPAAAVQPGDGTLDDPAFGQDEEAFGLVGALDDLDVDPAQDFRHRLLEFRPLITAIGIKLQQEWKHAEQSDEQHPSMAVLNVGGMHDRVQQQALGVYQDMALLPLDLLARVISRRVDRGPPFSAALTLWLSMIAALGLASRPASSRHFT